MLRSVAVVVPLLLLPGPVHADANAQALVDRMMTALGGRDRVQSLRSLAVEADCSGPGGDFDTRIDSFRPGLTHFHQIAGDRSTEIWSTPARTWRRSAAGGIDELDGGVRSFVRGHEFHLLVLELESRFTGFRLDAAGEVRGRACRRITMVDEAGNPAAICVDESDGLPLALELNPPGAAGPLVIRLDDWRPVDGLLYFHAFELTEGPERTFTYRYRSVKPNDVDADRFVPPIAPALKPHQDALLEILRSDRTAHLTTDAALLTAHLAPSLVEVHAGVTEIRDRSDVEATFRTIFRGATYDMWEDASPPLIRLSADAQMAWVVRTVRVRRHAPAADGGMALQEFTSAYTATYEMQGDAWRMTSVTSTFRPG